MADLALFMTDWKLVPNTLNYEWNSWVARYQRTIKGLACYKIYRPDGTIYGVGGLPRVIK